MFIPPQMIKIADHITAIEVSQPMPNMRVFRKQSVVNGTPKNATIVIPKADLPVDTLKHMAGRMTGVIIPRTNIDAACPRVGSQRVGRPYPSGFGCECSGGMIGA
jgi:hypothetical protein